MPWKAINNARSVPLNQPPNLQKGQKLLQRFFTTKVFSEPSHFFSVQEIDDRRFKPSPPNFFLLRLFVQPSLSIVKQAKCVRFPPPMAISSSVAPPPPLVPLLRTPPSSSDYFLPFPSSFSLFLSPSPFSIFLPLLLLLHGRLAFFPGSKVRSSSVRHSPGDRPTRSTSALGTLKEN